MRCDAWAACDAARVPGDGFDDTVSKTISTPASSLRWSERDATVPQGLMRYFGSTNWERLWPVSPIMRAQTFSGLR